MYFIFACCHIVKCLLGNCYLCHPFGAFLMFFLYILQLYLFEELFSPIITPFVLCFGVRSRAQEIVDFYRNFTVEVTGVGDVCSFAQMDIRKHGNPQVSFTTNCLGLSFINRYLCTI